MLAAEGRGLYVQSHVLQALYEWTASTAPAGDAVLPELYVDGFDAEQIWGQLDAFSGPALKRLRKQVKRLGPDILLLDPETEEALEGMRYTASFCMRCSQYAPAHSRGSNAQSCWPVMRMRMRRRSRSHQWSRKLMTLRIQVAAAGVMKKLTGKHTLLTVVQVTAWLAPTRGKRHNLLSCM